MDLTQDKQSRFFGRGRTRTALATAGVVAVALTPFAVAQGPSATSSAGEGDAIEGGVRNPSNNQSQALTRETEIIANTGTYGTRQSNKSNNGGGAIYGCRSAAGGTPAGNQPCIRSNNLEQGLAFEFNTDGAVAGTITSSRGANAKPFTTNATGVADGLNADRVDGLEGAQLRTRWALVTETGQIEAQSGDFSVVTAYPGGADPAGNQNVYLKVGEDVRTKGLGASIAIQNTSFEGNTASLNGEVAVGACGLASIACAPAGTEANDVIVVAPRDSDGTTTVPGARKRFYVEILP
jgi:hypothetical protein